MKNLCILLFLFSSILVQSQNWEIAVPGDHYYFKQKIRSSQEPIKGPGGFSFDSISFQQGSFVGHELSKVLTGITNNQGCDTILYNYFGKQVLINNLSQILEYPDGKQINFPRFFSSNQQHHIIYSDSLGNKLRASYLFHDTLTYDGQLDSVVYAKIRHMDSSNQLVQLGYNDTLIISKSHGILRMLDWAGFPNSYGTIWEQNENLPLTKGEVYDYQPGDEFHIEIYNYGAPPGFYIAKILARMDSGLTNKIKYVLERYYETRSVNFNTNPPTLIINSVIRTDTVTYSNLNTVYGGLPYQPKQSPNPFYLTTHEIQNPAHGLVSYNITDMPYYSNGCWSYQTQQHRQYRVIKGIGLLGTDVHWIGGPGNREILLYYKKGNKTWGTPHIITGIESKEKEQNPSFFPNPSAGIIQFDNLDSRGQLNIRIYDVKGVLMKSFQSYQQQRLDLSELSNGMYFIELFGEDFQFSEKLIIQKP